MIECIGESQVDKCMRVPKNVYCCMPERQVYKDDVTWLRRCWMKCAYTLCSSCAAFIVLAWHCEKIRAWHCTDVTNCFSRFLKACQTSSVALESNLLSSVKKTGDTAIGMTSVQEVHFASVQSVSQKFSHDACRLQRWHLPTLWWINSCWFVL